MLFERSEESARADASSGAALRFKVIDPQGRESCWGETLEQARALVQDVYSEQADRCQIEVWEWWHGQPQRRISWSEYMRRPSQE